MRKQDIVLGLVCGLVIIVMVVCLQSPQREVKPIPYQSIDPDNKSFSTDHNR